MRFDYYSATISARAGDIIDGFRKAMLGTVHKVERQRGLNNYEVSDLLMDACDEPICRVLHGGSNGAPHVRASGIYSPDVADVLRRLWPGHAVSRVDVAVDFDGPGCWAKLFRVCLDVASSRKLKWATYGDFREDRDEMAGRTAYVGSRQSAVMVRLYEKGKEITPKLRVGEPPVSLDWCRLEVEVKPQARPVRIAASAWQPGQVWGCSTWSRSVLHRASGEEVQRIMMTARKETDARRAIRHMAVQYQQAIQTVVSELGTDEALMEFIRQVWREAAAVNRHAA